MKLSAVLPIRSRAALQTLGLIQLKATARPTLPRPTVEERRAREAADLDLMEDVVLRLAFDPERPAISESILLHALDNLIEIYRLRCLLLGLDAAECINAPLRGRNVSLTNLVHQTLAGLG